MSNESAFGSDSRCKYCNTLDTSHVKICFVTVGREAKMPLMNFCNKMEDPSIGVSVQIDVRVITADLAVFMAE